MLDSNTISLIASATTIILAILAIVFSVWFFVLSKKTESKTSNSLTKIETQAESLQKLTGRWMDRLTKYVTTDKPSPLEPAITQLGNIFKQLPQILSPSLNQQQRLNSDENFYSVVISIYFYSAQTNYWSQANLPKANEFNKSNDSHTLVSRIIDTSYADFQGASNILINNEEKFKNHKLFSAYLETKNNFSPFVKSVAEIFIDDEHNEQE